MNLRAVLARALSSPSFDPRRFATAGSPASLDVIALGKGAARMVEGWMEIHSAALRGGLVVLPDGAPTPRRDPRLQVLRASHPLPDERSVAAGEAALALAHDGAGEEVHVLVSGGASSLVFAPVAGVSLAGARDVSRALLASGADVRETNVVRRHLSRVHGGGLLRAASPRGVLTWIESDVIDGAPHDVGSGPSVPDPTTAEDARRVLARHAPSFALLPLVETLKPGDPAAPRSRIASTILPLALAEALAAELRAEGVAARVLPSSLAEVASLAEEYASLARSLKPGEAVVRVAEPSLQITTAPPGAGGRCTHLAAKVAPELPPGVAFLAAASDGVDGESGTGGAIVTRESFPDRAALDAALAAFDTGPLHLTQGTALPLAPSGLNLADIHALAYA